jgi:aryl-alcohol dehydrogenase-like predicted oxidoreductase
MRYATLGKTGLTVSVVGLGTWQFGGEWGREFDQPAVDAIVGAARETGITLVDTAECYGDHLSERLLGQAIRSDRERWVVATKFGHRFKGLFQRDELWSAREVERQLEDSLRALGTEWIDLYQFHSGNNRVFDNDELWSTLRRQVEAGKVRHLGISISSTPEVWMHQTGRATRVGAEAIQLVYNRLQREPEREVLPACREQDLGVLARVPLASGFLSGKYRQDARFDDSDVRSRRGAESISSTIAEVEQIRRQELPPGVPMAAWALAWCLAHPAVHCVIPGAKSPEQVRQNAAAAELEVPHT